MNFETSEPAQRLCAQNFKIQRILSNSKIRLSRASVFWLTQGEFTETGAARQLVFHLFN
jgi:hypothetical protein